MKVERAEGFRPIHIVLETEEEAELLYYMLNCGEGMELMKYLEKFGKNFARDFSLVKTRMYQDYASVYR